MKWILKPNWKWVIAGLLGLASVYVLQNQLNLYAWLHGDHYTWYGTWGLMRENPWELTITNKTFRYILNDFFSILIIHGLFQDRKYTRFAVVLLLFGLFILLPLYYSMVFFAPSGFSSMISHFHRIILNPVLMMLLIPYLYNMELQKAEKKEGS